MSSNNDEKRSWDDLKLNEIKGLAEKTIEILNKNLIITVQDLALADAETLGAMNGISVEKGAALILAAQTLIRKSGLLPKEFCTFEEVEKRRKEKLTLKTGSKQLDNFLKGGIETQAVTEFYGEFGAGKSQVCFTSAINATLPIEQGGYNSNVIYIDTEGTVRPERFEEMCNARGLDWVNDIRPHLTYCRTYNAAHLEGIIEDIHVEIQNRNVKLVIIDSFINLHRAEFAGRATLNERQIRINKMLKKMIKTVEMMNVAFIITNQVTANPDGTMYGGDPQKPVGGNIIGHASTYRIYLRKSGANRVAKMVDSPYHAYSECRFSIDEKGISEAIEK